MTDYFILWGTLGCHLCEEAEQLLTTLQHAYSIRWQYQDIIDLPEHDMLQLATKIPVLQQCDHEHQVLNTLYWQFSLVDVVALL